MQVNKKYWILAFALFMSLVFFTLLLFGLGRDPHLLPSARIHQTLPNNLLEDVFQHKRQQVTAGQQHPFLFHVWASWCPACQYEHRYLLHLQQDKHVPIVALAYKDESNQIRAWLAKHGNPYLRVFVDPVGDFAYNLGVYGTPETYLVDAKGYICKRHVGVMTGPVWQKDFAQSYAALLSGRTTCQA